MKFIIPVPANPNIWNLLFENNLFPLLFGLLSELIEGGLEFVLFLASGSFNLGCLDSNLAWNPLIDVVVGGGIRLACCFCFITAASTVKYCDKQSFKSESPNDLVVFVFGFSGLGL